MQVKPIFIFGILFFVLVAFVLLLVFRQSTTSIAVNVEEVSFSTVDNVRIQGDWYSSPNPNGKAVILLHMMNRDKSSWIDFASFLSTKGFDVLAIDLRGHGNSIYQEDKFLDYKLFTNAEHQASINDVSAALDFIEQNKKNTRNNIFLVGASIGANLALQSLQMNPEIKRAVLMSPGLDYRGIKLDNIIQDLSSEQSVMMLSSKVDTYSTESIIKLEKLIPASVRYIALTNLNKGHGTDMFQTEPDLDTRIVDWLLEDSVSNQK